MKEVEFYRTMQADPVARAAKLDELRYMRKVNVTFLLLLVPVCLGLSWFRSDAWLRALLSTGEEFLPIFALMLWGYTDNRTRTAALEAMTPDSQPSHPAA